LFRWFVYYAFYLLPNYSYIMPHPDTKVKQMLRLDTS